METKATPFNIEEVKAKSDQTVNSSEERNRVLQCKEIKSCSMLGHSIYDVTTRESFTKHGIIFKDRTSINIWM